LVFSVGIASAAPALRTDTAPAWRPTDRAGAELEQRARLVEMSVPGMRGHSQRVAVYAALIAQRAGLDGDAVSRVRRAGALHDIGKAEVPPELLRSPEPLRDERLVLVQAHAAAGARIVAALGDPELTTIVRHHHERFDGGGYPDGLAGAEIPLGAGIVAVADTFDAVTSERPYRPALGHLPALELLGSVAGSQLDPRLVAAFRVHCSGLRGVTMAAQRR
jgi:putative nucleotidyltransferase with HDIG domain